MFRKRESKSTNRPQFAGSRGNQFFIIYKFRLYSSYVERNRKTVIAMKTAFLQILGYQLIKVNCSQTR